MSLRPNCSGCSDYSAGMLRSYFAELAAKKAVVSVDVQLLRNGSLNQGQGQLLASAWAPADSLKLEDDDGVARPLKISCVYI